MKLKPAAEKTVARKGKTAYKQEIELSGDPDKALTKAIQAVRDETVHTTLDQTIELISEPLILSEPVGKGLVWKPGRDLDYNKPGYSLASDVAARIHQTLENYQGDEQ